MKTETKIRRFPWGTRDDAQVVLAHFGSKSMPLIAQGLREIGLQCRLVSASDLPRIFDSYGLNKPKLVVLSGGDQSVYDKDAPTIDSAFYRHMIESSTVLGICYGAQLMAVIEGGSVRKAAKPENGVVISSSSRPFGEFRNGPVLMNHGDEIDELPQGWQIIASTELCRHALVGTASRWAVQFHPEMGHTRDGKDLFRHVAFGVAQCVSDYAFDPERFVREAVAWQEDLYPDAEMMCGVSGGVDSAVAFLLARKSSFAKSHGFYIDNGWFRENEADEVRQVFGSEDMSYIDASTEFYDRIDEIEYRDEGTYYESMRKEIGATFIDVFVREARNRGLKPKALIQGTNAADIIESMTGLKSHHNVALPEKLGVEVMEPLAGLYKSEIRTIAAHLGLPLNIVQRQPFPGPGLSLRVFGPLKRSFATPLRRANAILEDVVRKYYPEYASCPCQYYVALLPAFTTGLMGDNRVLGYAWVVRMVWSEDRESYASLDVRPLTQSFMNEITARLTGEVTMLDGTRFVRVFYEITGKPPSTTEPH